MVGISSFLLMIYWFYQLSTGIKPGIQKYTMIMLLIGACYGINISVFKIGPLFREDKNLKK